MPIERNVYIVRHGHREDRAGDDEAWRKTALRPHDPGLSELGQRQAHQLALRLANAGIAHILSSPFLRAIQTADAVARLSGKTVKIEEGIGEWLNPRWFDQRPELLGVEALANSYRSVDRQYASCVRREYPEHDEATDAWPKAGHAADLILRAWPGDVLFVGHGSTVLGLSRHLGGADVKVTCKLCSLVQFQSTPGGWRMVLNGCTEHLARMPQSM